MLSGFQAHCGELSFIEEVWRSHNQVFEAIENKEHAGQIDDQRDSDDLQWLCPDEAAKCSRS